MLKATDSMKEFERSAANALESILKEIPIITLESVEVEPSMGRHEIDVLVRLTAANTSYARMRSQIQWSASLRS